METAQWPQWIPLFAGIVAMLIAWGSLHHKLGKIESKTDNTGQKQNEAKAENAKLHQETKTEYLCLHEEAKTHNERLDRETKEELRREIRMGLQALREHTHDDSGRTVALYCTLRGRLAP